MNLNLINKEFERLEKIENYLNYQFEPRYNLKNGKRHIYFKDLEKDFTDELNAYGFSPFIQETYTSQKRNKTIMGYKTNYLNQGLINYVRKKNLDITNKDKIIRPSSQKMVKTFKIYEKIPDNKQNKNFLVENIYNPNTENQTKVEENFLKKALDNLARNRLNISSDEFKFPEAEEIETTTNSSIKKSQASQVKLLSLRKSNFLESIGIKIHNTQVTSLSGISMPLNQKLNYHKFKNSLNNKDGNKIKRLIRLKNVDEVQDSIKGLQQESKNYEKNIGQKEPPKIIKTFLKKNTVDIDKNLRYNVLEKKFKYSLKKFFKNSSENQRDPQKEKSSLLLDSLKNEGIATRIYSEKTREKKKKFQESLKKIFTSKDSLFKNFAFNNK